MQELIEHLYLQHVNSELPSLSSHLSHCQPTPILSLPKGIIGDLTPLFVRNILSYDELTLRVTLSKSAILMFLRVAKTRKILEKVFHKDHKIIL